MRDPATWAAWDPLWLAVDGHPLSAPQLELFQHHTGRTAPRPGGYREFVVRKARQVGWSQIIADRACWRAVTAPSDGSAAGTFVVILNQDNRAAVRTVFGYIVRNFEARALAPLVRSRTADSLVLENGVTIACYPCRPSALRGLRALAVYMDEFAWFMSTDNRPLDQLALRAAWPCRAMTGGELGIGSSPAGASGEFHKLNRHFGRDDASTLVYVGKAQELNPLLTDAYIQALRDHDPESAAAEIDAEFLSGLSTLFDHEALDACVRSGVRDLLPAAGIRYEAFVDPSGGVRDAFTAAVAHRDRDRDRIVIDAVRAWKSPFSPPAIVAECAEWLKTYSVSSVTGDRYGGEFPRALFREHGLAYNLSEQDRSALYLNLVPLVQAGATGGIEIPDDPATLRELRGLERKRGPSGRSRVDHRPGAFDDRANSLAGAASLCAQPRSTCGTIKIIGHAYGGPSASSGFVPATGM